MQIAQLFDTDKSGISRHINNPQCGNVFIFFNKLKDKVKILWWNANGFVLYYKRLEKRRLIFRGQNSYLLR
ncbi:MAG TPA: IS66 family insertion sequence element accessory protein TnpB [Gammaproteobacteria bacterium]|nr:IS66 family insertion sequence element accessory protein TnpB [Gammaproteobacteria bacterium]